jgi:HEXXH motif-containing protein
MPIATHQVPATSFTLLAHGRADAPTMRLLHAGQLSKHVLLVRTVLDAARPFFREASAARLSEAVTLLDEVQRRAPAAAADVLGYPLVGAWAAHCLRRLRGPSDGLAGGMAPLWVDLAQLGSIAAAAAIRAGLDFEVAVPVRGGEVALPTLGCASVESAAEWGVATVTGTGGWHQVRGQHNAVRVPLPPVEDAAGWAALRRIEVQHCGWSLVVHIDDLDPYRDCYRMVTGGRLDAATVAGWRVLLGQAWELLVDHHPGRVAELTELPITVVPVTGFGGLRQVNATARDAIGAMALSPPSGALALALSLIHEYQHSKLGALLDLLPLFDLADTRRFYSPWRADPRPISGVLQGAYAFLAVTNFWFRHATRSHPMVSTPAAQYELARGRGQVRAAVETLVKSEALTAAGERFVAGIAEVVDGLAAEIPDRLLALARVGVDDHRLSWRLRNVRVDDGYVDALAEAWLYGGARPLAGHRSRIVISEDERQPYEPRQEMARLVAHEGGRPLETAVGQPGDAPLIAGDYEAAAQAYLTEIRAEPLRIEAWAGLAVARTKIWPDQASNVHATTPELVRALYARLRKVGGDVDPDSLARWLAC